MTICKFYQTIQKNKQSNLNYVSRAFTIVELLVVIVVIGILAVITMVSYQGIVAKANDASSISDLSGASKVLELYKVEHALYPTSLDGNNCPLTPAIDNQYCLKKSSSQLVYNYTSDGNSYNLDAVYGADGILYNVTNSTAPVKIANGWLQISVGSIHTCAITVKHQAYCWGYNPYGQIGDNTSGSNRLVPTAVNQGAMPSLSIKSISSGGFHTCAVASNDQVYCWGYNLYGQIGDGTTETNRLIPTAINKGAMPSLTVRSISLGNMHTCVIASNNQAYCWGYNADGQIGDSTSGTNRSVPTAVSQGAMPSLSVKTISTGSSNVCVIAANDQPYCWGSNIYGQIGNNASGTVNDRYVPTAVYQGAMPSLIIKDISVEGLYVCAIASNNQAYCWGNNGYGQIGDNTWGGDRLVPTAVLQGAMPNLSIKSISAGSSHTCAIASNDQAYCWGYNPAGQIGDNTSGTNRLVPTAVVQGAMPNLSVKSISASDSYTCAIASNSQAYCWGGNGNGQIGDNTSGTNRLVPTAVSPL